MGIDLIPGMFGVTIYYGNRPVKKPCAECPFVAAAQGRDYLAPGRLDGIKFAATMGQLFPCHKTVYRPDTMTVVDDETGEERMPSWDGKWQACAGATQFAEDLAVELGVDPVRIGSPPNVPPRAGKKGG